MAILRRLVNPMSDPLPITVCIPVRNEERNLPRCLEALGAFQDILVVDSGSTDATAAIARSHGARVAQFSWDGRFPKKRNWVLRQNLVRHPWVLFLDADEIITPSVVDELRQTLPATRHSGFWLSFTNWFMGRPLRHGDVMRKLALFRVGAGEYERFPEDSWSTLDMEVHEHPVLSGSIGEISSRLEHHDHRDLHAYIARHNEYSTWEARRHEWLHQADPEAWSSLNARQQFKYRHLNAFWLPWVYWAASLFFKRGFLDGSAGWRLAGMKRRYFQEIRLKILEAHLRSAR